MKKFSSHNAVLLDKLKDYFNNYQFSANSVNFDLTLGGGSHSQQIISVISNQYSSDQVLLSQNCYLHCFDFDQEAWQRLKSKIDDVDSVRVNFHNENFVNWSNVYKKNYSPSTNPLGLVLADLGPSQYQLQGDHGLSYRYDSSQSLDMRIDTSLNVTAADILNALSKKQLHKLFLDYSDIKDYNLVNEIILRRRKKTFSKVEDLISALSNVYGQNASKMRAKVFQGLRIAVNLEYENLERLIVDFAGLASDRSRLLLITFHSGEDRVVTSVVKKYDNLCILSVDTPNFQEIQKNPRSRSAKLYTISGL